MIGAYAGEIGQTQFLPSSYIKYGVDFDGDGRVDLRHSVPDVLASTANLLHTSRLQGRRALRRGQCEFRSDARMEQGHDLSQDDRVFCRPAGGAVAFAASAPFATAAVHLPCVARPRDEAAVQYHDRRRSRGAAAYWIPRMRGV